MSIANCLFAGLLYVALEMLFKWLGIPSGLTTILSIVIVLLITLFWFFGSAIKTKIVESWDRSRHKRMSFSKPKRYRTYGREFLMLRDKEVRQEQLHLMWKREDCCAQLVACGLNYIAAILAGLFMGAIVGIVAAVVFFSIFFIIGSAFLMVTLYILSRHFLRPLYFKRRSAEANAKYDICVHEFNGTVPEGYRRFKLPVSKPTSNDELKVMLDSMPATEATKPLVKRLVRVHADLIATDEALAEIQTQEEASKANAT